MYTLTYETGRTYPLNVNTGVDISELGDYGTSYFSLYVYIHIHIAVNTFYFLFNSMIPVMLRS